MGTIACTAGQLCCAPGYADCGSGRRGGAGCVDLLTDPANCGTACTNSQMHMGISDMCI